MTLHKVFYLVAFAAFVVAVVLDVTSTADFLLSMFGWVAVGLASYTAVKLLKDRTL